MSEKAKPTQRKTSEKKSDKTIQDIIDSMSKDQKKVLYFLVGLALSYPNLD